MGQVLRDESQNRGHGHQSLVYVSQKHLQQFPDRNEVELFEFSAVLEKRKVNFRNECQQVQPAR